MKTLYRVRFFPLLSAAGIFAVGFYYSAVKAGIPYQDPPPELLAQYLSDMKTGETLMLIGLVLAAASAVLLIVFRILKRKNAAK